jgi:hypothetical protein
MVPGTKFGGVAGAESRRPPAPAEGVGRDLGPAAGGDFPLKKNRGQKSLQVYSD